MNTGSEGSEVTQVYMQFTVPTDAAHLYLYLSDCNQRAKWDEGIIKAELIPLDTTADDDLQLISLQFDRLDFSLARVLRQVSDSQFVIASRSMTHKALPLISGSNRATVGASGYVIRQQDDPCSCQVQYVLSMGPTALQLLTNDRAAAIQASVLKLISHFEGGEEMIAEAASQAAADQLPRVVSSVSSPRSSTPLVTLLLLLLLLLL